MQKTDNVIGVIPCRMAATRLPGKPLRLIAGVPMIERVYRGCAGFPGLRQLVVATDSAEIQSFCRGAGIPVEMTSADHASGTDRVWEVARRLGADAALNIQGDEPMVRREMLATLLDALFSGSAEVATLCTPMRVEDVEDPAAVKVAATAHGRALYFSRAPIPYPRDGAPSFRKHLGLYAYSRQALERFHAWPPSWLERQERLEQLRFLEHGVEIAIAATPFDSIGIDTPADLERAQSWFTASQAAERREQEPAL